MKTTKEQRDRFRGRLSGQNRETVTNDSLIALLDDADEAGRLVERNEKLERVATVARAIYEHDDAFTNCDEVGDKLGCREGKVARDCELGAALAALDAPPASKEPK